MQAPARGPAAAQISQDPTTPVATGSFLTLGAGLQIRKRKGSSWACSSGAADRRRPPRPLWLSVVPLRQRRRKKTLI
jgi:hypothetical protein